ncbi:MAG: hypothetical protein AB9919_14920 [Geobacteraceae bacterium]
MTLKKSRSRLGTNLPVTRGMSTLFGSDTVEQPVEATPEGIQRVTDTAEPPEVAQAPETVVTQNTLGTQVTEATPETLVTPLTPDIVDTHATAIVSKKKKVKKTQVAPTAICAAGGADFTPTRGLPLGWERHTYVIQTKHVELIEAAAYWDRMDKKDILRVALEAFFKGRKVKPLPQEKRRERKARAATNK